MILEPGAQARGKFPEGRHREIMLGDEIKSRTVLTIPHCYLLLKWRP